MIKLNNAKTFKTTKELLKQAKKDNACESAIKWCRHRKLDYIFKNIEFDWAYWAVMAGYEQFLPNFIVNKESIIGVDWADILGYQPNLIELCDQSKMLNLDWEILLDCQPQLAKYRPK